MNKMNRARWIALGWLGLSPLAHADETMERCLLDQLANASDTATVAELKSACELPPPAAVVSRRLQEEEQNYSKRYAITAHRMNYVLPLTYDQRRPSSEPFSHDLATPDNRAQKIETKFQFSFKIPLMLDVFGSDGNLMAGYTQRSFWQMYNSKASKPFRETNYEPEIWYQYPVNKSWLGWNLAVASLGWDHQSNGRAQTYSRSWNRIMGGMVFEHGEYAVTVRPWWRITEDASNDDNPDISHYLGNFDFTIGRKIGQHSFDLMLRNNLQRQDNRGAVQLGWSFPLPNSPRMRGYVQWFNGYGESLMDYNVRQNSLGIGVQLADW